MENKDTSIVTITDISGDISIPNSDASMNRVCNDVLTMNGGWETSHTINTDNITISDDDAANEVLAILRLSQSSTHINKVFLALCQRIVMLERSIKAMQSERVLYHDKTDEDVI